jgi:hypothetical protein
MIASTDTATLSCTCGTNTTTGEGCTVTHPTIIIMVSDPYPDYASNFGHWDSMPGDDRNYREHSRDSIEAMRPNPAIEARRPDKIVNCPIGRTRWFPGLGSAKDKRVNKRKTFLKRIRKGDRAVR